MGVATVAANRIALVVTKMITHLHVQYPLGQLAEQTVRANELDALLAGCATSCSTTLCSSMPAAAGTCYWICCHVVDRVSHGLTPFRISDQPVPPLSRQSPGVGDGAGGLE